MTERGTPAEHAKRQAARIAGLAGRGGHVLLGPVLLDPERVAVAYFVVGVPDRSRWHFERIEGSDSDAIEAFRAELMVALIEHRPIVIHDLDDELRMARACHAILPTEQTGRLCSEIAAERAAVAARPNHAPGGHHERRS